MESEIKASLRMVRNMFSDFLSMFRKPKPSQELIDYVENNKLPMDKDSVEARRILFEGAENE